MRSGSPDHMPGSMAGRRVAVTGATGFVGTHLVMRLVDAGANVLAVAEQAGWRQIVPRLAELGKLSLLVFDTHGLKNGDLGRALAVRDIETVVHLGYTTPTTGATKSRARFEVEHNVLATWSLFDQLPLSVRHICFASSSAVYGFRPPFPVDEGFYAADLSEYGVAKLAIESLLRLHVLDRGIRGTVLRYSTVFGPMETVPRAIPNFIRRALVGESPVIRGDGTDIHDYIHVSDAVTATLRALERQQPGFDTYNVASGFGHSIREVAERILDLTASSAEVVYSPGNVTATRIVCDITRARTELGYEPQVSFDAGLDDEIRWFNSQPALWRSNAQAGDQQG